MIRAVRSLLMLSLLVVLGAAVPPAAAQDSPHAPIPPAGIGVETLFEAAFPAETIPAENPRVYFVRQRYLPGAIFDRPAIPAAEYVLSGSLVVRSAGRVVVQRGSAGARQPVEEIAPGSEATVGAGDAAVYLSNGAAQTVRNSESTPAITLKVIVVTATEAAGALPRAFAPYILGHLSTFDWKRSALPVGPMRVRVERLTAAPGASVPRSTTELPVLRFVEAGQLTWAIETPATLLAPMLAAVHFRRGQAVPYQRQPDGWHILLRSSGDEPLVLLVLTTMPAAG
ncbi:MAG: hypothetical protein ACRDJC_04420 [Thermomicrobiales bacterium]